MCSWNPVSPPSFLFFVCNNVDVQNLSKYLLFCSWLSFSFLTKLLESESVVVSISPRQRLSRVSKHAFPPINTINTDLFYPRSRVQTAIFPCISSGHQKLNELCSPFFFYSVVKYHGKRPLPCSNSCQEEITFSTQVWKERRTISERHKDQLGIGSAHKGGEARWGRRRRG